MIFRRPIACFVLIVTSPVATSHAQSVGFPQLPYQPFDYAAYAVENLPAHFGDGGFLTATSGDNTPADNPITNSGATLGRVLFYDKRLSHNNSTACASCHQQEHGFADSSQFSVGFAGEQTQRTSMSLTNTKFYRNNRFFRDETAASLEEQVLKPIENPVEMGSNLEKVTAELAATRFYPDLFAAAFGSPEINADRISKAMSQFVRSLVSYRSKYDSAFDEQGTPHFDEVLTLQENLGRELFHGVGRCSFCHTSEAQVAVQVHNNGLDEISRDIGAGDGEFKAASLRNVATREFFMHDGRFSSLAEVVEFYSNGIENSPNLDFRLRVSAQDNTPIRLDFTEEEQAALVAFLGTLTDWEFTSDPKFSNPFVLPCDFDGDESCDVRDLNQLLATGTVAHGVAVTPEVARFDLDGNSSINGDDVSEWLDIAAEANGEAASYQRGDANLDGRIDDLDLASWRANQFQFTSDWNSGDWNADGLADVSDFNLWNAARAHSVDNAVVPEPAGWWPLMLTGWTLLAVRRFALPQTDERIPSLFHPNRCRWTVSGKHDRVIRQ